ncbi:hypothetical protein FRC09_006693 [Ceratobasidium sp. 395]|nr:hypothetical protein FRC09_006693 [Ceratobasidium sp. 395]
MLRVQRSAICWALEWLKENNKKYYGDIVIEWSHLDDLPEDRVPEAVLAAICYEEDESMADNEYSGYVPGSYSLNNPEAEGVLSVEDTRGEEETDQEDVILLQHLGVMDNNLSKVLSDELMKWGLHNLEGRLGDTLEFGYAIQYGGLVNTFSQPP